MMEAMRRRLFTGPEESLLINRSAPELAARYSQWLQISRLRDTEVMLTPLCSVPLPVATQKRGPRRWTGVDPQIMWHPLMWLPDRLQNRIFRTNPDGREWYETGSIWTLRLIFELSAANLYNAQTGSWLDILSTVDMDIENPVDVARVEAWLQGEDDETLDSIDLEPLLHKPEPRWALESAIAVEQTAIHAALAQTANSLFDVALQAAEADVESREYLWTMIINLAHTFFGPAELDMTVWDELSETAVSDKTLAQASGELALVRERFWPALEELTRYATSV